MDIIRTCIAIAAISLTYAAGAADLTAITGDARSVVLHGNGKWEFAQRKSEGAGTMALTRPTSATQEWQSKKKFISIWYDPKEWSISERAQNENVEARLIHQSGDAYVMAIVERIEVPIQQLKEIALQNAKKAAPDAQIVAEKQVTINGSEGLLVDVNGTIQGIKFRYHGFYFSNSAGSAQIVAYTSQNLFDEYEGEFNKPLSGIQINQ